MVLTFNDLLAAFGVCRQNTLALRPGNALKQTAVLVGLSLHHLGCSIAAERYWSRWRAKKRGFNAGSKKCFRLAHMNPSALVIIDVNRSANRLTWLRHPFFQRFQHDHSFSQAGHLIYRKRGNDVP